MSDLPEGFQIDDAAAPSQDGEQLPAGFELNEDKYGTTGQQILTGLEGAASAATFGLSSALEVAKGVKPADIRARREENPMSHGAGQIAGLVGSSFIPGVGAAGIMERTGAAAAKALVPAASKLAPVANLAVKAAVENTMFQAGDEISKMLTNDPNQSAETAAANVGLAGLIGGATGGAIGSVSPLWNATAGKRVSGLIDEIKSGSTAIAPEGLVAGLKKLKGNAKEINEAAKELGAPLLEGQISASKHMQDIESMVMQSSTIEGVAKQQLLQQGKDAAENAINKSLGEATEKTQVDIGNEIKSILKSSIEAEAKPISELYNTLKQSTDHIPVDNRSKGQIIKNIKELDDFKFSGSTTQKVGSHTIQNLENIASVDDIKRFKTSLYDSLGPMASPGERKAVGEIAEKLTRLEENTIIRQAERMAAETNDPAVKDTVLDLIKQRKEANQAHIALREKMSDLGEVLGKKRIRGTQDFLEHIEDLSPEKLTTKLFSKGNSEALEGLVKNMPDVAKLLFQNQKNAIRNAAMKDGVLNGTHALREINKLSPEVKKLMFSADELKKFGAAKTYLDAIPANINPSMTSKAEAYRRFFTNPATAPLENIRDYGLNKLLKSVVKMGDDEAALNSVMPSIIKTMMDNETSPTALKSAVEYGLSVVKGEKLIKSASKEIYKSTREVLTSKNITVSSDDREKLEKRIAQMQKNPDDLLSIGGETGHYMPQQAVGLAETTGRVLNYLQQSKPKTEKKAPLDPDMPVSNMQKKAYERTLDIAAKPLVVLQHIKDNTLIPADVMAIKSMYPSLYSKLSQSLTNEMINHVSKDGKIPYATKQSLSLFLGQPLDSSLSPETIMAAQASFMNQQAAPEQGMQKPKKNTAKLSGISDRYMTGDQASQERRSKHHS